MESTSLQNQVQPVVERLLHTTSDQVDNHPHVQMEDRNFGRNIRQPWEAPRSQVHQWAMFSVTFLGPHHDPTRNENASLRLEDVLMIPVLPSEFGHHELHSNATDLEEPSSARCWMDHLQFQSMTLKSLNT